ncbi:alpha/beta hydrolase [Methylobacterium sp. J-048]|uniref:alpha/beta hydrolase n=1 Tax=Methylobacterium sp. J-048 TaxID=2836635 RepID=UPI001FB9DFD4|nr:alpha/beta hydrolase [Methylobacterium sp. J-048]MCJ2060585.1 alpha/beta hydrolase [Methylobacterium sp. J-048]
MRILLLLLAIVALVYLTALVALAVFQRRLIYPGAAWAGEQARNRLAPPGTEVITLTTEDGERLFALWRPPLPGCGVVVSFHGNGSRPAPHAARFAADPWRGAGWGVLAPAYRGYPGSTGSPSEDGLIRDGMAAVAAAMARAPGAPILLHGHSLGAAVAVAMAGRVAAIGLYLEAPFDSLTHAVWLHVPLAPSWLLRDTYRSDLRIRGGTEPVLIVQGTDDPVVPAKLARALAAAAGPRARFALVPGDHVSIFGIRDREAEAEFRGLVGPACRAVDRAVP